jgi:hypothetical protein
MGAAILLVSQPDRVISGLVSCVALACLAALCWGLWQYHRERG